MSDTYERYDTEGNGSGFIMGLLAGTVIGAGLGMLLAPKSGSDLRGQIGEQARNFSTKASEQYRRASEKAGDWAERGREMMHQARNAMHRTAEEARGYTGSTSYTGGSTGTQGSYGNPPSGSDYGRS
jgi:gas vesicle protein